MGGVEIIPQSFSLEYRHQFCSGHGGLVPGISTCNVQMVQRLTFSFLIGFDIILLSNFYAYPAFVKQFGVTNAAGVRQIPAKWQAGLGNGGNCGQIIGLLVRAVLLGS